MDPDTRNLTALEEKYEKILEKDPQSNTFVLLAEVLIKRKKLRRAIEVLNKGLSFNRSNITARFLLGRIYFDNWMIDQAKKHFEYVLSISPDNLATVNYLVQIYKSEDKPEKALKISRNALFYFPGNADILEMINSLQSELNEKEKKWRNDTIKDGKNEYPAETKTNDESIISETLADLYMAQGYYRESIALYEKLQEKIDDPGIAEKKQKAIKKLFTSR